MYENFQRLLDVHHVTAYKVAKETGLTTSMLTNWKKGRYTPKQDKLQKIAEYFGVTVDYLLTGNSPAASEESSAVDINDKLQEIIDVLTGEEGVLWDNEEISEEGRSVLLNWLGHDRDLFDSMRKK